MQKAFALAYQIWPMSEGLSVNLGLKSGKGANARGPGSLPQAGNLEGSEIQQPQVSTHPVFLASGYHTEGSPPHCACLPCGQRGFENEREPNSAQKPQEFLFPSPPLRGEDAAPSEVETGQNAWRCPS